MHRIEREGAATVLQCYARARYHHVRTETVRVGLDQADHHALLICRTEVDGASCQRFARLGEQSLVADQRAPPGSILPGKEFPGGDGDTLGIGDVALGIDESQLHGLQLQVVAFRRFTRELLQIEAFKDVESDERGETLSIGRELPHVVPPAGGADRLYPRAAVLREVVEGEEAASLSGEGGNRLGDFSMIKGFNIRLGKQAERARKVGIAPELTNLRHTTTRGKYSSKASELFAMQFRMNDFYCPAPIEEGVR